MFVFLFLFVFVFVVVAVVVVVVVVVLVVLVVALLLSLLLLLVVVVVQRTTKCDNMLSNENRRWQNVAICAHLKQHMTKCASPRSHAANLPTKIIPTKIC